MMLFAAEGGRAMLVELSVMEQRYHAVMEVVSGTRCWTIALSPFLACANLALHMQERMSWTSLT